MKPKRFIAINTERVNGRLVFINSSVGDSLYDPDGISVERALDFLFALIRFRDDAFTTVFVCYAFSLDNEFIFATMPRNLKDKLFKSQPIKKRLNELEAENERLDETLYTKSKVDQEYQIADFSKHVNKHVYNELTEVRLWGYDIKLANGKSLAIKKGGKVITFYDICGFFGKPAKRLRKVVREWLNYDLIPLDKSELEKLPLHENVRMRLHSALEVTATAKLANELDNRLQREGISLSRWHGATALSSWWLGVLQARGEYYNYRYRRQLAPELYKAVRQANYGGRSEQFKIGTLKNVYVYDINSAYAFAIAYLPKMLSKPNFVRKYTSEPFSIWYLDYDFRGRDCYFGPLPNRDVNNNTRYRLKGSGYFWQPEVRHVIDNYHDCVQVKHGFVLGYERADFAKGIDALYQARVELARRGDPLEKVFKLALASIYGKFCQHNGQGHYYNLFYAGFITSLTRMMLLEAVKGKEQQTISFQTDAIHTLADNLDVTVDDALGNYKRNFYDSITYIDNGVYFALNDQGRKIKARGFREIEFDKALAEMQRTKTYTALAEFFVGHNLFTKNMFTGAEYLHHYRQPKTTSPVDETAMRLFEVLDIDLSKDYYDSKPLRTFSGRESAVYRKGEYNSADMALDSIEAGRI